TKEVLFFDDDSTTTVWTIAKARSGGAEDSNDWNPTSHSDVHRGAVITDNDLRMINECHKRLQVRSSNHVDALVTGPFLYHLRNRSILQSATKEHASVALLELPNQAGKAVDCPTFCGPDRARADYKEWVSCPNPGFP